MSEMRKQLMDKVIHKFGFESDITIRFCRMCEKRQQDKIYDYLLIRYVERYMNIA